MLRALAPFGPLFHRLGIVWRKNWRGIKGAARFGQACWRYEKKVLARSLAPLAPVYRELKIIWRKNVGPIKRAAQFVDDGWQYGKKILLPIFTPLISLYNRLETILEHAIAGRPRREEPEQAQSGTLDYNRNYQYQWGDGTPYNWNEHWKSRTALLASIVFGVAFIAHGSMGR